MDTVGDTASATRLERDLRVAEARRRLPHPEERRRIRVAAGVTQNAMAEALGVRRHAVLRWEHGRRMPNRDNLLRYVELLDRLERGP